MWRHLHRTISVVAILFCSADRADPSSVQESAAALQEHAAAGERALAEGRYADAEREYETLRKLSPATAEVHARLGLIYFQEGKFDAAVPTLREAIRLKPGLPKVDALLAMSLSEIGRYEEALPGVIKAFSQSSDSVLRRMAGLHLQRIYTGLGRDQDAVDVALKLSRLYPDDAEVLYHSGRLFANFAYLQTMRLATIAPESVWLHQAAAEANESQGLYDAALREYQQVLALSPKRPGIRFRIGRTLLERSNNGASTDDVVAARKAFEEELKLDPTNANAAYELAEMHRKAGELEPARQRFQQALSHYPAFEHAQIGLARTLIALGTPAEALPHLKTAIERNPESEVAYYQMAQAFKALGNAAEQEKALAQFTRLRDTSAQRRTTVPQTKQDVTPQTIDVKSPK
jgi:tetratricopeptide (TPR) repeat protein